MRTARTMLAGLVVALVPVLVAFGAGYRAGAQQAKLSDTFAQQMGRQLAEQLSYKSPFETDAPDHIWAVGDDRSVTFIHMDKPYAEATRVIYVGFGIRGRWCAEDQQRIEALAGKGFTHFHRTAKVATWDAGHGGAKAGEPGYWLKHMAVGPGFKTPWGDVRPGVTDTAFMPTAAPRCGS
jgi:hypothetical protein